MNNADRCRRYRAAHRDELNARDRERYASDPAVRARREAKDADITRRMRDAAWRRFEGMER